MEISERAEERSDAENGRTEAGKWKGRPAILSRSDSGDCIDNDECGGRDEHRDENAASIAVTREHGDVDARTMACGRPETTVPRRNEGPVFGGAFDRTVAITAEA